MVSPLTEVADI